MAKSTEIIFVGPDAIQVRGPFSAKTFRRHGQAIAGLLRGSENGRRRSDIQSKLTRIVGEAASPALEALEQEGFLADCEQTQGDPIRSLNRLHNSVLNLGGDSNLDGPVELTGGGQLAEAVERVFSGLDIECRTVPPGELFSTGALAVVCSDQNDPSHFRKANSDLIAATSASAFIFVGITASSIQMGPFVRPGATACYECYHQRMRSSALHLKEFDARADQPAWLPHKPSPFLASWAAHQVACLVLSALQGTGHPSHPAELWETNPLTGRTARATILRLPDCPACRTIP
ncbi:TOMM precursor leader peptide-binding protein [Brevundimonas sp.]|uniref:TOMM precursor leader peptide-binding protein n=1 Tax=Brevundimonas sp. TaxID=1871086 RepID=UPI0039E4994A